MTSDAISKSEPKFSHALVRRAGWIALALPLAMLGACSKKTDEPATNASTSSAVVVPAPAPAPVASAAASDAAMPEASTAASSAASDATSAMPSASSASAP